MKNISVLAYSTIFCVLTVRAFDNKDSADTAKSLVGTWEISHAGHGAPPIGSVYEFSQDGKVTITAKIDGKETILNGTYRVDGDRLHLNLKLGNKEEKEDDFTIARISDNQLVIEGKGTTRIQCKRLK